MMDEQNMGDPSDGLPDGWIEHDGGPCPVSLDSSPGVIFRDGCREEPGIIQASAWILPCGEDFWLHKPSAPSADIIAYKPEATPNA